MSVELLIKKMVAAMQEKRGGWDLKTDKFGTGQLQKSMRSAGNPFGGFPG
ncbi:hypothetical protein LJC41_07100 [Desulfosarcina sp. OttesenSCG-928-G17]|nr:hypothetical protein [Desulfosarcina sp. OttesenSCG-928-G17]